MGCPLNRYPLESSHLQCWDRSDMCACYPLKGGLCFAPSPVSLFVSTVGGAHVYLAYAKRNTREFQADWSSLRSHVPGADKLCCSRAGAEDQQGAEGSCRGVAGGKEAKHCGICSDGDTYSCA